MIKRGKNNRGQIWIETVIYTLIAFVMIGLVLSFIKPKIEEWRDQTIVEQSLNMLEDIDNVILAIRDVPGNQRLIKLGIKRGILEINGEDDKISFEVESKYAYSQPGENVSYGNVNVRTEKTSRLHTVTLTSDYADDYNLTYKEKDETKALSKAPTPYQVYLSNKGTQDKINIDFDVV